MIPLNSDHIYIGISFLRYASVPGIYRTTVRSKRLMKNESVREWGTGWLCASEMKSEVEGRGRYKNSGRVPWQQPCTRWAMTRGCEQEDEANIRRV